MYHIFTISDVLCSLYKHNFHLVLFSLHGWLLNNTELNCLGSLTCGYFSVVNTTVLQFTIGWIHDWMRRSSECRGLTVSYTQINPCVQLYSIVWIYLNLLSHSLRYVYLGYFQYYAIANSAIVNNSVLMYFHIVGGLYT